MRKFNIFIIIILIITCLCVGIYIIHYDSWCPRTPQSILRGTMGISISRHATILEFSDNSCDVVRSPSVSMILLYDDKDEYNLVKQCTKKHMKKLPITEGSPCFFIVDRYYSDSIKISCNITENGKKYEYGGYYLYDRGDWGYTIFVLDTLNNRLTYTYNIE